jgi:hypothetical protein
VRKALQGGTRFISKVRQMHLIDELKQAAAKYEKIHDTTATIEQSDETSHARFAF